MKVVHCGVLVSNGHLLRLQGWTFDTEGCAFASEHDAQQEAIRAALLHIAGHHGIELADAPERLTLDTEREALNDIARVRGKGKTMDQDGIDRQWLARDAEQARGMQNAFRPNEAFQPSDHASEPPPEVDDDHAAQPGPVAMLGGALLALVFALGCCAGWMACELGRAL